MIDSAALVSDEKLIIAPGLHQDDHRLRCSSRTGDSQDGPKAGIALAHAGTAAKARHS